MPIWSIEPLLQRLRINKVIREIPLNSTIVDIGCDTTPLMLSMICNDMKRCVGVDIEVEPKKVGNMELIRQDIQKKIKLPDKSADVVTMLAVMEHLKYPEDIAKECFRILKPGGKLLITVPSPQNKGLLEILAKFQFVRPEMIDQHENYFTHERLYTIFEDAGFDPVRVEAFELGFNTYAKAVKPA